MVRPCARLRASSTSGQPMGTVYAVRVHKTGGPEELRYERVEVGTPGPGEARVRHTAIGLNFTDIHFRTGRYPLPHLPHVIGMEAAGVVVAVGDGVTEVRPGDRVAYASEKPRAYVQETVMPVARLIRLPDWIDDQTGAAVTLKGLTAQYLVRGAYQIKRGEMILIQAAAGGVGIIMCQMARHLGVNVNRVKLVVYVASSVLTGLAVSVSGAIGYVGLLVPHLMRMFFGTDYRLLIPASAISGAIIIVVADTLARTVVAPTELPVGAMTETCALR